MTDFKTIMDNLKIKIEVANPARMQGINAVFQFELTGEGNGAFQAVVYDGLVIIATVDHESPNVTIIMDSEDFVELLEERLSATSAFMAGKVKVKGDLSLAMKLQSLLG